MQYSDAGAGGAIAPQVFCKSIADYAHHITNPPPHCVSAVSKVGRYFHYFVTKLSCLINSVLIRI